jgi:uncharacterized Zn finger protein
MSDEALIAKGLNLLRKGTEDIPIQECPECGGDNVQQDGYCDGGMGNILYENASCSDCGAVWRNHYEIFQQEIVVAGRKK